MVQPATKHKAELILNVNVASIINSVLCIYGRHISFVSKWPQMFFSFCRYRYRDDHFVNTLRSLLEVMYCSGEVQKDLLPLSTLHMMASSHSLFLPTMLDSHEEPSLFLAKGRSGGRVEEWKYNEMLYSIISNENKRVWLFMCLQKRWYPFFSVW